MEANLNANKNPLRVERRWFMKQYIDLSRPVRAGWVMVWLTIIVLAGLFEV